MKHAIFNQEMAWGEERERERERQEYAGTEVGHESHLRSFKGGQRALLKAMTRRKGELRRWKQKIYKIYTRQHKKRETERDEHTLC